MSVLTLGPRFAHGDQVDALEPLQWLVPLLVVATSSGAYMAGAVAYRARRAGSWSPWRTASWLTGTILVALALSPVLALAQGARGHMVQHLLLGMLAPLGLAMGAPVTLLLGGVSSSVGRAVSVVLRTRAAHAVAHPMTAAALNIGGMFALYLTPLYALSTENGLAHRLVHAHLLAAGYLFTWSIAGPDPAPRRPRMRTRVGALVMAAGAHSFLAKLLYAHAGQLPPGGGHTIAEMQVAAQWMYYGGDVVELLLAAALFAAWYRLRRRRPPPPIPRTSGARVPAARPRSRNPVPKGGTWCAEGRDCHD